MTNSITPEIITLTYEEWLSRFKPQTNPLNPTGPYNGLMYETYGQELDEVYKADIDRIWTLVDNDGATDITSGFHHVNRLGYFITEVPCPDNQFIDIPEGDDIEDMSDDAMTGDAHLDAVINYIWKDEERDFIATFELEIEGHIPGNFQFEPEHEGHIFYHLFMLKKRGI